MLENLLQTNPAAAIVLTLAVILFAGFAFTRLTKRLHLPNVTGYILAGVLLGPYVLGVVPAEMVTRMDFVTDVALSFIAFDVGRYFKLAALKKSGAQVLIVTVFESLIAGVVITLTMIFLFHLSIPFSLLLGAIGCATAPASTIMTASFVPETVRFRRLFSRCSELGLMIYSPSMRPTCTPAIGPLKGISDMHSARDAPNIAVISGVQS